MVRKVCQVSIWAILVVLCLGLPRFLVVCNGPHCHGSIEFVHVSGSCCQDHHEVEVGCRDHAHDHDDHDGDGRGEGDRAQPGRGGCTDIAFAIEEGPVPERYKVDFHDGALVDVVAAWLAFTPSVRVATVRPPATGPPRTDRRTDLLATTLLLI